MDSDHSDSDDAIAQPSTPDTPGTPTLASSCPQCNIKLPVHNDDPHYKVTSYGPWACTEHANVAQTDAAADPCTYAEAMLHADAAKWDAACEEERHAFECLGVYEVVPWPKGRKIISSKWVFHIKHGPDSAVQKYKA